MSLPIIQTTDKNIQLLQTRWASFINPIITAAPNNNLILINVPLVNGTNTINHGLGRNLQGWYIVRRRQWLSSGTPTAYDIYDKQDSNTTPQLTLILTCNEGTKANPVLVNLVVF